MEENETNRLVKGALLLSLAGLISKVLSAGYRVPLQNLTGDVGFYIYQQVYPILGIAMMLSLYGFPQAISKMMAEMRLSGKRPSFRNFYLPLFFILLVINGVLFLFMLFNADKLAVWIGDSKLTNTYQFAAFVFLFVPFTALLRGVFQGNLYMKPTAYSQVFEQLTRVAIIIGAAVLVANHSLDFYKIGQSAAIASLSGAFAAILVLLLFFVKYKPVSMEKHVIPWNYYVKTLLFLGVIAALNHMLLLVIQFADAFTLIPSLMDYGLSKAEAMETKGIFDRGQPLIQLGTVLGSSFALALIPSLSKHKLEENEGEFNFYIRSALLFSFYLAVGATIGLIAIFPETNTLLYQDDKGTVNLQILVLSIFLSSVAITASSILQGLGYIKRTAAFILLALFAKWILNQFLVSIMGITGGALATVFSLLGLLIVVLFDLRRKLPGLQLLNQIQWISLLKASMLMLVYLLFVDFVFPESLLLSRVQLLLYVLFLVTTGAAIFLFSLLRGKVFSERELLLLPYASLFIRIYREREKNE
ncbi:putative polysaccharide biosynthesis protein [Oceanobacillus halophilus]|uniref:Polysaccharide biosynthesis protein n=1 Tax=Oceanobacillus halophilus TaxID=930130 RepID=A0A495A0T4_9BACI|nr:polysaccharide biosynthesis protein [Oceanobacillus halophilus]RKQ33032.1 polysaccharide biosynthesis protein [Oceanobacillus halophilus]